MADDNHNLMTLTAEIVAAHVSNNRVPAADIGGLIQSVFGALNGLGEPVVEMPEKPKGAVSARASIKNNHILSMIDGKPYKLLRKHVAQHGYTPDTYRETFGLPHDYPMVAPAYAAHRRELAIQIGLGRKPASKAARTSAEPAPAEAPEPAVRRGRKPKAAA